MRASSIALAGLALALFGPAHAQKAEARKTAGAATKYLPLDGLTFQKAPVSLFEGQVTLTLQGGKATGASLDACMGPDPLVNRADRLRGSLDVKGASLVGSGRSEVAGQPWSIDLRQAKAADGIKVEGRVEYAGRSYPFSGEGIALSDEPTLYDGEGEIDAATPISDPKSINQVEVDVPSKGLADMLRVIAEEGASLNTGAVTASCAALRTGTRTVKVVVAPDRAAALVSRLNATSGLAARMEDEFLPNARVRVAAGESPSAYGEQGERALAGKVSAAATGVLPGLSLAGAPARDPATGRWRVALERPGDLGEGVSLRERDVLTFSIGRSTEAKDRAIVIIEELTSRYVVDPGKAGAMVIESPDATSDGVASTELMIGAATDAIRDAVARALDGEVTDTESGKWVAPPPAR
jgi:hypothetical protein